MADALRLPKVGLSVVPPTSQLLSVPSDHAAAPSLMPMAPYWKPTPMVEALSIHYRSTTN